MAVGLEGVGQVWEGRDGIIMSDRILFTTDFYLFTLDIDLRFFKDPQLFSIMHLTDNPRWI